MDFAELPTTVSQNQYPAVAVLNAGRIDHRMHELARGIHQDMSLLPDDCFARIVT